MIKALETALLAVAANHQWHKDYDDYDGYVESDLHTTNMAAITAISDAIMEAQAPKPMMSAKVVAMFDKWEADGELKARAYGALMELEREVAKLQAAALAAAPQIEPEGCRKCAGPMKPSKALAQTMSGMPDFPGDGFAVTLSPAGPGVLIDCLKCANCGWSVTGAVPAKGDAP